MIKLMPLKSMGMSYGKKLKICLEDIVTVTFIAEISIKIALEYYASWTLATSCIAFPMYDVALFCNDTNWYNFEYDGYEKSKVRLEQF